MRVGGIMGKSRIIGGKSAARRGSAIIETGLLLPLMVFMVCGTMDFARVFYAGIAISSAARAGVQFGSLNPANAGLFTAMNDAATADAANQGLTGVTASSSALCACAGSTP